MSNKRFQLKLVLQGSRMCRTVFVEVPEMRMQRCSQEMQPLVHSSTLHSWGEVMYYNLGHSPGP